MTENYFKYLEDYNEKILEFVSEMDSKHMSGFYGSFYSTCNSMIENGADLSNKQTHIIEREMKKRGIKIPDEKSYRFKITMPLTLEFKDKKIDGVFEFGEFISAVNKDCEFSAYIEQIMEDWGRLHHD